MRRVDACAPGGGPSTRTANSNGAAILVDGRLVGRRGHGLQHGSGDPPRYLRARLPATDGHHGGRLAGHRVAAAKADVLSLTAFEVELFGWMAVMSSSSFCPRRSTPIRPPTGF